MQSIRDADACETCGRTDVRRGASGDTATVPRVLVIDSYDSFVYNLVQYLGELGADPIVRPQRRDHRRRGGGARARRRAAVARPGPPGDERHHLRARSPRSPTRHAGARCVSRPSGDRPRLRRRRSSGARADARQDLADRARRARRVRRLPSPLDRHALPLARRSTRRRSPTSSRSPRARRRRRDGGASPRARRRGRAVPPGEHPDRARSRSAAELPRRALATVG